VCSHFHAHIRGSQADMHACFSYFSTYRAQKELDEATEVCAAGDTSEYALNRMTDAQEAFAAAGGYNVEEKVNSFLRVSVNMDVSYKCTVTM
jgi:hypothetical protein